MIEKKLNENVLNENVLNENVLNEKKLNENVLNEKKLNENVLNENVLNVIDLFCGCGGMSKGLIDAGFNIIAGIDIWDKAINSYKQNFNHMALCENLMICIILVNIILIC